MPTTKQPRRASVSRDVRPEMNPAAVAAGHDDRPAAAGAVGVDGEGVAADGHRVGALRLCRCRGQGHDGQRRASEAPACGRTRHDPLQRLTQRCHQLLAGAVEAMVAAGHLEEAPRRSLGAEQGAGLRRRQVAVAGRLDDGRGRVDAVRERVVGGERRRRRAGGRAGADASCRRNRAAPVVGFVLGPVDGQVLAVGEPDGDHAGRGRRAVRLGSGQDRERRAARPAGQDRGRRRRQRQGPTRAIEDHRIVEAQLLRAQPGPAGPLDLQEGARAEPDRRLPGGREHAEHLDGGAEPAAVAARVEDERAGRHRPGHGRRGEMEDQRLAVQRHRGRGFTRRDGRRWRRQPHDRGAAAEAGGGDPKPGEAGQRAHVPTLRPRPCRARVPSMTTLSVWPAGVAAAGRRHLRAGFTSGAEGGVSRYVAQSATSRSTTTLPTR